MRPHDIIKNTKVRVTSLTQELSQMIRSEKLLPIFYYLWLQQQPHFLIQNLKYRWRKELILCDTFFN